MISKQDIQVSIVEDSIGLNKALEMIINATTGMSCKSAHFDGEDAVAEIVRDPPDIVLVDLGLPGITGQECITTLKAKVPKLQFLVLTIKEEDEEVFGALKAGANGYLLKSASPSEIIESIKELYDGGAPMSANIARKVIRYIQSGGVAKSKFEDLLTNREKEVLELLALGKFYKEIASDLYISIETVKCHCHNIYEKLHVSTRTEALNKYYNR